MTNDQRNEAAQDAYTIPDEIKEQIIEAAVAISGKDRGEFSTMGEALQAITENPLTPEQREKINEAAEADGIAPRFLEAVNGAGGGGDLADTLQEAIRAMQQGAEGNEAAIVKTFQILHRLRSSEEYQSFVVFFQQLAKFAEMQQAALDALDDLTEPQKALIPYVEAVLFEEPPQEGIAFIRGVDPATGEGFVSSVIDLVRTGTDENSEPVDSAFIEIIERARELKAQKEIPKYLAKIPIETHYPVDKPNHAIWRALEESDATGQMALVFNTAKDGTKATAEVCYMINFEHLPPEITKKLTPYDKRVCIACADLWRECGPVFSTAQIYRAMRFRTKRMNDREYKKINASLDKMRIALIYLDNQREATIYRNYTHFRYDGSLLPFERMRANINGKECDAIHLFREPPLIDFARSREQYTTIPSIVLESPLSKTDFNLNIEDYILERISTMKHPDRQTSNKMLFTKIFETCGIAGKTEKNRKAQERAKPKIFEFLDHCVSVNWIAGYTKVADGVIIDPGKTTEKKKLKKG